MSSDDGDGVYVLVLRDMFLVLNSSSIENIQWSYSRGSQSELVPTSVLRYFKKAKQFPIVGRFEESKKVAHEYAVSQDSYPIHYCGYDDRPCGGEACEQIIVHYTEYGVSYIKEYKDYTLAQVRKLAQDWANEELQALKKKSYSSDEEIEFLEQLLQNEYQ
jgi:hypothetical protein